LRFSCFSTPFSLTFRNFKYKSDGKMVNHHAIIMQIFEPSPCLTAKGIDK